MKFKKLFTKYLVIVLMCTMVVGFGLPRDADAITCSYEGYVVQIIQPTLTPLALFNIRDKPIDAGQYSAAVAIGSAQSLGVVNTLRSAYQNNTKVGLITESGIATCPAPNLSIPGWYNIGFIEAIMPSSLLP